MTRPLAKRKPMEAVQATEAINRIATLFTRGDSKSASMVETAWKLFNSKEVDEKGRPLVPASDKVRIFKTFAEMVGVREIALAQAGLKAAPGKVVNHAHFTQVNLSVDEFDKLPDDLKGRFMREQMQAITNRPIEAPDGA